MPTCPAPRRVLFTQEQHMETSVHNLVMAYMHAMNQYGSALEVADTIDDWKERKEELAKLENWLGQEAMHMVYALTYMYAEDEQYQTGIAIPDNIKALVPHADTRTILTRIVRAISNM
jgi:hypothetical protein